VGLAEGTDLDAGTDAVAATIDGPGGPEILTRDEFIESEAAEVAALLNVIYGLLVVAILIALMTIANTLSLSVTERTRELGLLRAVGQTRPQLRAMVRWESVVVATFGAVGGLGLGTFLGWGAVRAASSSTTFASFAAPIGTMIIVFLAAVFAGVQAGMGPAWRASRMDILEATKP
jgi:putative ABC transport system permease protein